MSTIDLVRSVFSDAEFVIGNYNGDYDSELNVDPARHYFRLMMEVGPPKKRSRSYVRYQLLKRVGFGKDLHYLNGFYEVLPKAREADIVLSLGGDLYAQTYGWHQLLNFLALGEADRVAGKPFVVWPATIGPFDMRDAIAIKHRRTVPQVILRWDTQHGFVAVPKSSSRARLKENIGIWNFFLSDVDMAEIDSLNSGFRVRHDPDNCDFDKL